MAKPNLRSRLLLSHLIVLSIAVIALAGVSRLYTPRYFVVTLERMEGKGIRIRQIRGQLMEGFEDAWARGMFWSILLGGIAATGTSYFLSRRLIQPLLRMETITRNFAKGDLSTRVPPLEIPEFNRLAHSFNRMAADLENVEQRRRELVSDLTHELRTPLTIVRGYLEGMADGTIEPCPEAYARLIRETIRLQRLIDNLQELSKLEAGYLPVQLRAMPLEPLLRQVVSRFADQLAETGPLQLQIELPTRLSPVYADPERVEQILVNLLSNALRYTPAGQVTVSAEETPEAVWVAVEDTGIGIAPEDLPHVFERFWRADPSRDRASGGTGIGLAICQRLVELQGGQIQVESQPGQGTCFRFSLPKPSNP